MTAAGRDEDYRDYPPHERPDIHVLVDGTWWPGELHAWVKRNGEWSAHVGYSTGASQNYRDTVAADHVQLANNREDLETT